MKWRISLTRGSKAIFCAVLAAESCAWLKILCSQGWQLSAGSERKWIVFVWDCVSFVFRIGEEKNTTQLLKYSLVVLWAFFHSCGTTTRPHGQSHNWQRQSFKKTVHPHSDVRGMKVFTWFVWDYQPLCSICHHRLKLVTLQPDVRNHGPQCQARTPCWWYL